ncbi:MAG: hypothetical protein E4H13_00245 [Calditrichales bacterium]|nr:MAG: hypothetical protein E4H13_00245 [Calditrichales bacterium]
MTNRWLREITDITGVEGVLLVSHSGQVVEKIGTQFDAEKLEYIAHHVVRMFVVSKHGDEELKEVEVIWYDYQALAMNAGSFVLVIFCGSTKALSLLRITINVVIAHLLEDKKFRK